MTLRCLTHWPYGFKVLKKHIFSPLKFQGETDVSAAIIVVFWYVPFRRFLRRKPLRWVHIVQPLITPLSSVTPSSASTSLIVHYSSAEMWTLWLGLIFKWWLGECIFVWCLQRILTRVWKYINITSTYSEWWLDCFNGERINSWLTLLEIELFD